MRHVVCVVVTVAAVGCAAKARPVAPPKAVTIDLAAADALFDAGCYVCLKQAYEEYDRGLNSVQPPAHAREKTFVSALLLAVRHKEIGLDAIPWLERARALSTPDERLFVEIAESLAWTSAGIAPDFEPPTRPSSSTRDDWRALLDPSPQSATVPAPLETSHYGVLKQYLLVTLRCTTGLQRIDEEADRRIDLGRPILRYRVGLCGLSHRPHLEAVLASDPRFVEASFFVGRYEMASGVSRLGAPRPSRAWLTTAVAPLLAAHQGLPEAPVVSIVFAGLMRSRGELNRALALYDEALVLRPAQREALLGRTVTLTYLSRPDDAISTATRMIELGTWHLGAAHYWRAFNYYRSSRLEAARSDIAEAERLQFDADVLTLSGIIAYDQKRPVDARASFNVALQLDRERCPAHWYLGMLGLDEEAWPAVVSSLSTAGACYQRSADAIRTEAGRLPPDLPDEARQQQLASFEDSIATSLRQAGRSFFNAAQASIRIGDKVAALAYARSAASYPEMKERAESLVQDLER